MKAGMTLQNINDLPLSLKSTQNCFVWNETAKLHTESTAAVDKVYTNECINLLVLEMLKKKKTSQV